MKIGDRVVVRNVPLARGRGDFHDVLVEYDHEFDTWEIRDDFHNTRYYPAHMLELE